MHAIVCTYLYIQDAAFLIIDYNRALHVPVQTKNLMMVDKNSSVPLYVQIQTLLLDQIRAGDYAAGAQVPSELEIAGQHHVSRMTARKALDTLVSKGILYRSKGKGTYVAESMVSYGLSTMLSFSQTLRAQGYDVQTQVLRQDVIPGSPDILEKLQLGPESQLIVIRRLRLIADQPAAIHTAYVEYRLFAPILEIDLSRASLLESIQRISGIPIAYTQDSVRADVATTEEASRLGVDACSPVLRVEGVAYGENGHPTRLTRAVYRGDMFRMMVKNAGEFGAALKVADLQGPGGRRD
jgi:GntR family transcriptional regulator